MASKGNYPSGYLLKMPAKVLFGDAWRIEDWCARNQKVPPRLLDLEAARDLRANEAPRYAFGQRFKKQAAA